MPGAGSESIARAADIDGDSDIDFIAGRCVFYGNRSGGACGSASHPGAGGSRYYERAAGCLGKPRLRAGAVVQRSGSRHQARRPRRRRRLTGIAAVAASFAGASVSENQLSPRSHSPPHSFPSAGGLGYPNRYPVRSKRSSTSRTARRSSIDLIGSSEATFVTTSSSFHR